jgi:uncharacterized protein (TIRG00374 family)
LLLGLAFGILAGVAVVAVLGPVVGGNVGERLLQAPKPAWLALALVAVAIFLAADGLTLAFLLRAQERSVGLRAPLRVALESNLVAGATSFGGLEIPYQVMLLRRLGLRYSAISSVLALKALIHVTLLIVIALAAFLPVFGVPFTPLQRLLIVAVLAILAAVWLIGALWLRRPWRLCFLPVEIRTRLASFREALGSVRQAGWPTLLVACLLQLVYWAAVLSIVPLVLYGLGWQGELLAVVTRQAALQVLLPFSPLPGGAGVAELGFLGLIGTTLPPSIRLSSLVIWRLLTWLVPMAVGAAFLGMRAGRFNLPPSRRRQSPGRAHRRGPGSGYGDGVGTDRCA